MSYSIGNRDIQARYYYSSWLLYEKQQSGFAIAFVAKNVMHGRN